MQHKATQLPLDRVLIYRYHLFFSCCTFSASVFTTVFFRFSALFSTQSCNLFNCFRHIYFFCSLIADSSQQLQPPRFTTQPSSSGSIVGEGRTKILQCHALGKCNFKHASVQFKRIFYTMIFVFFFFNFDTETFEMCTIHIRFENGTESVLMRTQ